MNILPSGITEPGSFKRQIILSFVIGFFLLAVAFSAYQVRTESAYLYRGSTDETFSLAKSLAASSRSWVLANDVAGLQEVVHSFQSLPELRYAMVISTSGRVLAHSDAAKRGQFVSDEASLALIKSPPAHRIMIDDESVSDIAVPIMVDKRHIGWARIAQGRKGITDNLQKMMLSGALFVLMAVVLSLLAALLIAKRLGYRIGYLTRVAEKVQAGDYATRVNISGADEIAKLANSLNHMLDVLARDEEQLRVASLYTRSLIEASLDPLVTISPEGKITDVNQATENVTGRSRAELIGTDFSVYFTEPDKAREGYRQVFAKGSVTDYSLALRHSDGHITDVLYNASVYRNEAGEVLGVFAAARDITEHKRAEATRTQLAAIVESSNDAIIGKNTDGIIVSWNKAAERIYGYSTAEIIGKPVTVLAPPACHTEIHELLEKVGAGGTVVNHESERIRKDGALINVALTLSPIRDAAGNITGISTIARDITERKKAEFALRQSEEALKEAQRIAHLGSWYLDIATNQVFWSEELYKMYGFDPSLPPPLYTESMQLFTPESWERLSAAIAQTTEAGIPYALELETVQKDGGRGWMLARGELVRDAHGAAVRVRGVVMDITERKLAENALREKEERLALATANNGVGVWDWNLQTQQMIWDDSMYTLYHIRREDFSGTEEAWRASLHPDDLTRGDQEVADAIAGKKPFETEFRVLWPNGEIRYIKAVAKVFRDDQGTPLRMLGINMDVSERRKAEIELRRSEHGLAEAQRIAHLGNWELNLENNTLIWSDEIYRIFEIDPEKFGASYEAFLDAIHPDDRELVNNAYTDSLKNKQPYDIVHRLLMKDGRVKYVNEKCETHYGEDGKPLRSVGTVHDITLRKQAENELRELNNDFVTLLDNTGDFIYFKDQDSSIRFCSQTLANITGHASWRDMIGKHDLEIFPEDTARIYYEEELPIFREGKPLLNKTDPYYDEQGKPGWVNTNKWPVFGDDKKTVVGIFGISRDITELKQAEDKIKELNRDLERRVVERTAQLETANKELEAFSYSVSHDLRTPLRAIDGFSRILLDDYTDKLDDEGRRLLNVVRNNTERMSQLIDDILRFSRVGRAEISFAEIEMSGLVRDVLDELGPLIANRKIQISFGELPKAMGDRAMLHQVIENLLNNAIKFTGKKADARIDIGARIDGDRAVYYVKDNGAGFDMQYADKLFGVFQRLHGVDEFDGTGIGLAIVKRIVTRHGGQVWAEGKVNEGATIYFSIPSPVLP